MRKHIRFLALLLAVVIAAGLVGCQPQSRALSDEKKNRIQIRFRHCIEDRGFSGAVFAVCHGDVLFDGGAGKATLELENGTDVAYGVASLTKQFTAAAVMQLYMSGKLDLNDPLSKYFPDYQYGDKISIKHLLSQRSGIPDYMVNTSGKTIVISVYEGGTRYTTVKVENTAEENRETIRRFFLSRDLLFEPGTAFDYSDSNFALLAEIIAQVSGMSYHDYVRQNLFEPLGMEHSAFIDDYDSDVITKVAGTDRSEFSINYYSVPGAEYGCGDILSTPQDLYRWYRGLIDGKVVGESGYQLMSTNFSNPLELGYGYGLMISDDGDSKVVYHYGFIPSYYSAMIYIPAYDFFLTVLGNHAAGDPHQLAADLAAYFGAVVGIRLGDIN